jgi:carboxyl-terminal processing protease
MRDGFKAFGIALTVVLLSGCLLSAGFLAGYAMPRSDVLSGLLQRPTATPAANEGAAVPREQQFQLFWEAWDLLQQYFYGDLPDIPTASRAAVKGVLQSLDDPNTALLDPNQAKIVNQDMSGSFEGIGAAVRTDENGYFVIVQPYDGSPAKAAGLLPNDIVLEVNGTSVSGMPTSDVISLIRGPKGTTVKFLIFRPSTQERLTISVVRDTINIPIIEVKLLDNSIGYIRLREFNAVSADQVHEALRSLLSQKPAGLILDLRSNPGGLLDAAVRITSEFVGQGLIVEERNKAGQGHQFLARPGGLATDKSLPLVILVNQASASASEIVAGAVQDYGRGILVGQTTYGKGSVQIPQQLSDGSQLRITVAHWFTPKGRDISKAGLMPDIDVPLTAEEFMAGKDSQLDRALQAIKDQISK